MGVHSVWEEVPPVSDQEHQSDPTSAQLIAEAQRRRDITFWVNIVCSAANAIAYRYTGAGECFFLAVFCFIICWQNSD